MRMTKVFIVQNVGMAAGLACAYLVLLVPDSTTAYLLLSLLLMYATLFLLSFTLASVAGSLSGAASVAWRDLLLQGWRGWWRAAGVLLIAAGVLFRLYRLGWLWLPIVALIMVLALVAIPAAVRSALPALARVPRMLAYVVLALVLALAAWKIISTPTELSRPWMEIAYLAARVAAAFLLANLACFLLLSAGQKTRQDLQG